MSICTPSVTDFTLPSRRPAQRAKRPNGRGRRRCYFSSAFIRQPHVFVRVDDGQAPSSPPGPSSLFIARCVDWRMRWPLCRWCAAAWFAAYFTFVCSGAFATVVRAHRFYLFILFCIFYSLCPHHYLHAFIIFIILLLHLQGERPSFFVPTWLCVWL